MAEVNKVADKFAEIIHSYEPYKIQDTYSDFVLRYYELLVQVEDYFIDASMEEVLELVNDTTCKVMRMETERECQNQALCKDPGVSSDSIPLAHTIMNRFKKLLNFKKFERGVCNCRIILLPPERSQCKNISPSSICIHLKA